MARNLRSFSAVIPSKTGNVSLTPRLVTVPTGNNPVVKEFYFPFTPTNINYENLAPEYIEISRPQNQPMIGLSQYKLMKISFQFLLAVPLDGIKISIDEEIRTLREFANSESPVAFVNMDDMLMNPFNIVSTDVFKTSRPSSAFFFRITDLSLNSTRRNQNNLITSAEVSISLIEVNNPTLSAANFLRIKYPKTAKPINNKPRKKTTGKGAGTYGKPVIDLKTARKIK